jgi:hypothetical protein
VAERLLYDLAIDGLAGQLVGMRGIYEMDRITSCFVQLRYCAHYVGIKTWRGFMKPLGGLPNDADIKRTPKGV